MLLLDYYLPIWKAACASGTRFTRAIVPATANSPATIANILFIFVFMISLVTNVVDMHDENIVQHC